MGLAGQGQPAKGHERAGGPAAYPQWGLELCHHHEEESLLSSCGKPHHSSPWPRPAVNISKREKRRDCGVRYSLLQCYHFTAPALKTEEEK